MKLIKLLFLGIGMLVCANSSLAEYTANDIATLKKDAELGDAKSQYLLGLHFCSADKDGIPQDAKKAMYWWGKSAKQGFVKSQYFLGLCYYDWASNKEDYKTAVYWFTEAAKQGDANAQCHLGLCYSDGKGVTKSSFKAIYWYKKAAAQGHEAAHKLLEIHKNHQEILELIK